MKRLMLAMMMVCCFAVSAFAAEDIYRDKVLGVNAQARKAVAVTPSDTVDLDAVPRGLWIGSDGDIVVILADDTASVTLKGVSGLIPVMVKRVLATGTTATSIIGLY